MNRSRQVLAASLALGVALFCAGRSVQAQSELSSSPNPSVAGHTITLTTEACDNPKIYTVSFYYGTSPDETPDNLIGSVDSFRPFTITWTPPGAGTYYLFASADAAPNCEYSSNIVTQVVNAAVSVDSPAQGGFPGTAEILPSAFSFNQSNLNGTRDRQLSILPSLTIRI
jgi:hypothetical protein